MKTLITGATLARSYQLKNNLGTADVVLGDYAELPEIMLKQGSMIKLPNPIDAAYAHKMLALCLDNGIDMLNVLHRAEYEQLHEANLLFNEYGINILWAGDEIQ